MKIRSESIVFFLPTLFIGIVLLWFNIFLSILFFCITLFIIYFFRDPEREITTSNNEILLSPADGKIISIKRMSKEELIEYNINGLAKRISIFMSIFNVHVNRAPISGIITTREHIKGRNFPAFYEKSSQKNEHMNFSIKNNEMTVFFKLIAGLIAQRIKPFKKVGDFIKAGERIGMIKFGSRVDIIITDEWNILVELNQKVSAGDTILAKMVFKN